METSTIWLSPKDFSNKDSSVPLLIETPSVSYPSTVVTCKKDPGDMKWATMDLDLPQNVIIREITVCYQLTSENSFISQIRLIGMRKPDHVTIRHDDATDLRSTSHVRYTTKINGLVTTIETKMTLELGLNFLSKDDKIMLGAVGVKILFPERSCVNVRDFGALGGPDSRDASSIQDALDAVRINGGGTVCIPAGTYHLEKTISIGDNVSLQGAGLDSTIIRDHPELDDPKLLVSIGTPSSEVKNVRISGITFRNTEAKVAKAIKGKDAIRAQYVDGLLIEDCKFTEIEGNFAVAVKYARNVMVQRCQFYRWTYTGLFVGVESENIHVLDNVFDTSVLETSANTYTLNAGSENTGEGSFYVKNLWVERNIFLNNTRWSGITCHGGENIWIQDNYFANVKKGIDVGLVNRRPKTGEKILNSVSIPVLRNVHINNNIVIQGKPWVQDIGIVFTSHFGVLEFGEFQNLWAEDADITGNKILGFGGSVNAGAITVNGAKNVNILNNDIDSYATGAITLVTNVHDCKVFQNRIHDARGDRIDSHPDEAADEAAIHLRSWGLYGISIIDNTVEPSSPTKAPLAFLRGPTSPPMSGISVQIGNNTEIHKGKYRFIYATYLPVQRSSSSPPTTDLTQKNGDIIFTDKDKPGWRVSFPEVGYGSLITDVIVKVTIGADNKASIVSDHKTDGTLKGNYQWLPEGMNVTIKGAGLAGGPLDTRILKNDGHTLTLDPPAKTSVVGAELTYKPLKIDPL